MKNYARYLVSVTVSDTRREDPRYFDLEKVKIVAKNLTKCCLRCVSVIDTQEDKLVFRSAYGRVNINSLL